MIDSKTLRLITQNGLQAFALGRILDGIAALRTLLPYCATETVICAEAESLEKNYHYMLSFLRKGGDDQKRNEVQAKIQKQGITLLEQASRSIRLSLNEDRYSKAATTLQEGGKEDILKKWNSLLTPEELGEVQDDLFDLLWTSPLWTAQDMALWYDFLLGQREMVQQHLAGALFLSAWEYFDVEKMQLLALLTDSESHRTRLQAATYLLLLKLRHKEFEPLMPPLPDRLRSRKNRVPAQVQYEMLLMLVSEKDMEHELKEAESLTNDLLNGKEKLNAKNIKGIIALRGRYLRNRLQRGLDLNLSKAPLLHSCKYLNRISHWFLPFDKNHPLFQSVMIDENGNEKQKFSVLIDLILDCDVDKLATLYLVANDSDFSKAVQQFDEQEIPNLENAVIPEYSFRFIMQDLFRFFVHSPLSSQLYNPFRGKDTLLDFPQLINLFTADDLISCCRLLLELERYQEALVAVDDLISREGASVAALQVKAQALRHLKRYSEAINTMRNAEILEPENKEVLQFLVECYALQNRFEEELEYLQRLAELNPDERTYRRLIPITLDKLGRKEEALGLFFKLDYESTENDDDYDTIISCIADTALDLGKLDVAKRYTEKELELYDGKNTIAQLRMGHIKLLEGDWKGGLDHYEQYVNLCCEESGKDIKYALAHFKAEQERLLALGIKQEDLLLIYDILQSASENLEA